MLGIIIIWTLEDADEVHSSNVLQYIQNSESQTFPSSLIYIPLILPIKSRRHMELYMFDSYKLYLKF